MRKTIIMLIVALVIGILVSMFFRTSTEAGGACINGACFDNIVYDVHFGFPFNYRTSFGGDDTVEINYFKLAVNIAINSSVIFGIEWLAVTALSKHKKAKVVTK